MKGISIATLFHIQTLFIGNLVDDKVVKDPLMHIEH